jgi:competence protein ComEA
VEPILPPSADDDLDDLLRPPSRGPVLPVLLDRVRRTDRRLVVTLGVLAAVVVVVLAVVGWRSRPAPVSLPMASTAGSTPPGGGTPVGAPASTTTIAGPLIVHVAGAVAHPGLVTLPAGARAADAIEQAGGATGAADLERVNLAAPVADGMRVYVPAIGQFEVPAAVGPSPGATGVDGASDPTVASAPVDLNTATAVDLETLPGVGPATAAAILAHRDAHGPFASVDALDEVRGIGPAKLEQLRDLVTVG